MIDICKRSDGRWVLIELNPFAETTGGSMYAWRADHGLLHGQQPGQDASVAGPAWERAEADAVGSAAAAAVAIPASERPTADGLAPLRVRQRAMPMLEDLHVVEAAVQPSRMEAELIIAGDGPWDAFLFLAEHTEAGRQQEGDDEEVSSQCMVQ